MTKNTNDMLSALLTASLQTMNTLKDMSEKQESMTLDYSAVEEVVKSQLVGVHEKLDAINSGVGIVDDKLQRAMITTSQVNEILNSVDQNLTVVIQGVTALIETNNDDIDVKTVIDEYESANIEKITTALVTTQGNIQKMALALQSINKDLTGIKSEMSDLNDVYVDTSSRVKAMELAQTSVTVAEPQSLDDSIEALKKFV